MSVKSFDILNIVPGYKCNQSCGHCINRSGPSRMEVLSDLEMGAIQDCLRDYSFKEVMYSGGEPTLYVEQMNKISSSINVSSKVSMTTNGWFLRDEKTFIQIFSRIQRLDKIYLSLDKFHKKFPTEVLIRFHQYLRERKAEIFIRATVSDPMELVLIDERYKSLDIPIIYQKTTLGGRAKDIGVSFDHLSFHEEVLSRKCPNLGTISYIQGKGFSTCCSILVFDHQIKGVQSPTIEEHLNAGFYKKISTSSFGEIAKESVDEISDFDVSDSDPCALCERLFARGTR